MEDLPFKEYAQKEAGAGGLILAGFYTWEGEEIKTDK